MHAETRNEDPMWAAYGPFWPGSVARAIRIDNARRGYRTCWHCLDAFGPQRITRADGTLHRPGRGRWYCSRSCAAAYRREHPAVGFADGSTADVLVLDLSGYQGCET
jgi:hypothetical protein